MVYRGLSPDLYKVKWSPPCFPLCTACLNQLSHPALVSVLHCWTSEWQPVSTIFHENCNHPPCGNYPLTPHYFSMCFWIQIPHPNYPSVCIVQLVLASLVLRPTCLENCSLPSSSHFILVYYLRFFFLGLTSWNNNLNFPPLPISVPHLCFFMPCTGLGPPLQY